MKTFAVLILHSGDGGDCDYWLWNAEWVSTMLVKLTIENENIEKINQIHRGIAY